MSKTSTLSTLVYGTLEWAKSRAEFHSRITAGVIFLVYAVGSGERDYRFSRQIVGTRIPGRVHPVASYRAGEEVSNEVPVTPEKSSHKLEPLTIPLPWDKSTPFKEIKAAFRTWCKTGHPDVGGNPDTFRAVEQRYRIAEDKYNSDKQSEQFAEKGPQAWSGQARV